MPDWWLDEGAHAGDEHLDPHYVAGYERKSGFDPTEDVEVLLRHGLTMDSVVVDMGAGTGGLRLHAQRSPPGPRLLEGDRAPTPRRDPAPRRDPPGEGPRVRLRARRRQRSIEAWLSGAVADPTGGFTAEELAAHVRTEFSTYSWLFEAMLERVGFAMLDCDYLRSAYGTYTCARRST